MDFDTLIATTPLKWTDPRLRSLHEAFALAFPYTDDIKQIVGATGIHPSDLPWNKTGRQIWYKAFEEAAKNRLMPTLVQQGEQASVDFAARVAELRSPIPPIAHGPAVPPKPGDFHGFSADARKERQIVAGKPTLLDVRFLELGVDRARAVCRIEARFDNALSVGTGFRIGADRVLTNHHVVYDEDNGDQPASSLQAFFRYELGTDGKALTPSVVSDVVSMVGDRDEDWAVVTFRDALPADASILPIAGPTHAVKVDDRVVIVQHPNGMHKKVAFAHNLVRYVDDTVIQYWTDTEEGSSGSPVFNERWEVVALHHASVELGNQDEFGYRNQGRAIGPVAARIRGEVDAP